MLFPFTLFFCFPILACVVLMALPLRSENVAYHAQNYTPRKNSSQKTFEAKTYSPSKTTSQRTYTTGKNVDTDYLKQAKTATERPFETTQEAGSSKPAEHVLYKPSDKQITASTTSPNPATVSDEKPFESQLGALESKTYKPLEAKAESNPLLRPKQGIKEQGEK